MNQAGNRPNTRTNNKPANTTATNATKTNLAGSTNANLNKLLSNIEKNNKSVNQKNANRGPFNNSGADNKNNNNNNNDNNNNTKNTGNKNEGLFDFLTGNNKNEKKNSNAANKNNKNNKEPGIVEKGMESIGDTINDLKNSIMGSESGKGNNGNGNKNASINKEAEKSTANKGTREMIIIETPKEGEDSMLMTLLKVAIIVVVLIALYYGGNWLISKYLMANVGSPYLLNTTKNGKNAMVISQDPESVNYIPINKSDGQDGIQMTYGFWFLLQNYDYKRGEWKHVFHKGNASSYPNRAPGVWFHPDKNAIRVYMNTMENILEYADVDNIPVRKWVYMNIVLNNRNLDLYINGYLKVRKELSSIPKQNDDDFWINMYGGFEGYLSNIRYYPYAIDFNEMYSNIRTGPSGAKCIDTDEVPPYLDDNWWFEYNG